MQTQFGIVGATNCTVTMVTTIDEDNKIAVFDSGLERPASQQTTFRTTQARRKLAESGAEGANIFPV